MEPFGLRRATPDDLPEMALTVAEALATYQAWAPPGWAPPVEITSPDGLRARWARPGLAAHVNADVTAHVAAYPADDEPGAMHLMHLFVRPHRQGTGVASALLARAVEDARAAGATAMRLRTPEGNARGLAFYAREGWERVGPPLDDGSALGLVHVWLRRGL